jgi:hypothetical protein
MTNSFDLIDNLFNSNFGAETITVCDLRLDDHLDNIDINKIKDIVLIGNNEDLSFMDKYRKMENGFFHLVGGLTIEIKSQKIKSFRLKGQSLKELANKTRKDIEIIFGKADRKLTDGIMWVFDYVVDAKVLVYNKKKLFIHIDSKTEKICEIRFGHVDEEVYK